MRTRWQNEEVNAAHRLPVLEPAAEEQEFFKKKHKKKPFIWPWRKPFPGILNIFP